MNREFIPSLGLLCDFEHDTSVHYAFRLEPPGVTPDDPIVYMHESFVPRGWILDHRELKGEGHAWMIVQDTRPALPPWKKPVRIPTLDRVPEDTGEEGGAFYVAMRRVSDDGSGKWGYLHGEGAYPTQEDAEAVARLLARKHVEIQESTGEVIEHGVMLVRSQMVTSKVMPLA